MKRPFFYHTPRIALGVLCCLALGPQALAQLLPGAADAGRVNKPLKEPLSPPIVDSQNATPQVMTPAPIPAAARNVRFVLREVKIEGATAIAPERFADLYKKFVGMEVSLEIPWMLAGEITERYRNAGYFLTRAYVPAQRIKDGVVTINVVEGYIGKVELKHPVASNRVVKGYIDRLVAQRPIRAAAVESFLLRVNDLPGLSFRGVLTATGEKEADEGAVKLTLAPTDKAGKGSFSIDNFSSRFLGPQEASLTYQKSFLPLQQTSVSLLTGVPSDKLKFGTIEHSAAIAPDVTVSVGGGMTKAHPGFSLKRFDIDSVSKTGNIGVTYQPIRQRDENLSAKLSLEARNVRSDILGTPLTRDQVRAARALLSYDKTDQWNGYNVATTTFSRGLDILGASQEGQLNLSRAGATPDFWKAEFTLARLQGLSRDWSLLASASGQMASTSLYSSEQFGYGGQSFGRAYDASEITGDQGLSASLELRYGGWSQLSFISLSPYLFYDIGKAWNKAAGQADPGSGSSAGFGTRFNAPFDISGNLGIAFPLSKDVGTPIYGDDPDSPRLLLQISKDF